MEWISVKDRLPKKYSKVLITDGKGICFHVKQSAFNFGDDIGQDLYGNWCYQYKEPGYGCEIESDITHWMLLPELPKE